MLRIKRSVQAQYNTDIGLVAASAQAGEATVSANGGVVEGMDAMAALEQRAPLEGFVEASTGPVGGNIPKKDVEKEVPDTEMDNPDAIELGADEMQQ
jgi:hypothetical protein